MTPADVASVSEAVRRGLESRLSDLFVACPCEVVTYDPATERGDLRALVRRPVPMSDESIVSEELPIVPAVPILFPTGGGVRIVWDIVPGDVVFLHASSFAMGQWLTTGKLSDPGDIRQHHLGSCWAVPHCHAERAVTGVPGTVRIGSASAASSAVLGEPLAAILQALISGIPLAVYTPPPKPGGGTYTPADVLSSIVKVT